MCPLQIYQRRLHRPLSSRRSAPWWSRQKHRSGWASAHVHWVRFDEVRCDEIHFLAPMCAEIVDAESKHARARCVGRHRTYLLQVCLAATVGSLERVRIVVEHVRAGGDGLVVLAKLDVAQRQIELARRFQRGRRRRRNRLQIVDRAVSTTPITPAASHPTHGTHATQAGYTTSRRRVAKRQGGGECMRGERVPSVLLHRLTMFA
jgi:hypothetical protein